MKADTLINKNYIKLKSYWDREIEREVREEVREGGREGG